ncbi:MAG: helix-turn-helix domain-containing protein [Solidesulfovibrio sp. DCME]|uniref:helix-turn-helix domain-containing protein n=1 Tax=Solidesulfovibrio sp. DCME TaxID=3447380 RepID=UPI003D0F6489
MTCDVPTRLLKLLLCLSHDETAQARGGPADVPIRLTQGQIAAMTGSCQQTVSETLAAFEARGLIAVACQRHPASRSRSHHGRPCRRRYG